MKYFCFLILLMNIKLKSQMNCNSFEGADCKKACELIKWAEQYQGYKYSQIAFDKALELCPNFDYAYREKSVPYLKRGDFVTWKILIDKAVNLNPKNNLGYRGWCKYQFLRDYQGAIRDFESLEALYGSNEIGYSPNGMYHLEIVKAICYNEIGKTDLAIHEFQKQLAKKNYTPLLLDYYHLAVLYFEIKDYDNAKTYFEKQIANNDYYAEPYYYLALIYKRNNNIKQYKKNLVKAEEMYNKEYIMKDNYTHPIDKIYKKDIENL